MGSNPSTLTLFCHSAENNIKDVKIIIKISKQEALKLNKEYGVPYKENGISHTYTKHRHYFLCENRHNMNAINKIRNENIVQ